MRSLPRPAGARRWAGARVDDSFTEGLGFIPHSPYGSPRSPPTAGGRPMGARARLLVVHTHLDWPPTERPALHRVSRARINIPQVSIPCDNGDVVNATGREAKGHLGPLFCRDVRVVPKFLLAYRVGRASENALWGPPPQIRIWPRNSLRLPFPIYPFALDFTWLWDPSAGILGIEAQSSRLGT